MPPLVHVVEPVGLLLLWQPADETKLVRTRRVVGEIARTDAGGAEFRYLYEDSDYQDAWHCGFRGFPAFDTKVAVTREGVLEALMRRLPSRRREDFDQFLQQHSLPIPFGYSDIALLGYTGARLPSDGFSLVPLFPSGLTACDYIAEVAGVRHVFAGDISSLRVGSPVTFEIEAHNQYDEDAVMILLNGAKLGYVNRALRRSFGEWLRTRRVSGTVSRVNGEPDRPMVHVRVEVR